MIKLNAPAPRDKISDDLLDSALAKAESRADGSWSLSPGDFGLHIGQWAATLGELKELRGRYWAKLAFAFVAGFFAAVMLMCVPGCGGATPAAVTPNAVSAVGYEASQTVWRFVAATMASEHGTATALISHAAQTQEPKAREQCGDGWQECIVESARVMLSNWEKETAYEARARRLEAARIGLVRWHALLQEGRSSGEIARGVAESLITAMRELEKAGDVEIPDYVRSAMTIVEAVTNRLPARKPDGDVISRAAPAELYLETIPNGALQ